MYGILIIATLVFLFSLMFLLIRKGIRDAKNNPINPFRLHYCVKSSSDLHMRALEDKQRVVSMVFECEDTNQRKQLEEHYRNCCYYWNNVIERLEGFNWENGEMVIPKYKLK